jgi:hypothetical protein
LPRPGDGFEFHVERSLECPGGIHVGLRPPRGQSGQRGPDPVCLPPSWLRSRRGQARLRRD